jgi:hypothetical protein
MMIADDDSAGVQPAHSLSPAARLPFRQPGYCSFVRMADIGHI